MQVVTTRVRGPLVADECGEAPRGVGLLCRVDRLSPCGAIRGRAGQRLQRLWKLALRERDNDLDRRVGALAVLNHVVPTAAGRVGQHLRFAREELWEEAHVVGMIGDHQEVQRTRQPCQLPARRHDLLTPGEPISLPRTKPCTEGARVHRVRRMQVRVPEQRPGREVAPRIGRVRALRKLLRHLGGVGRADIAADMLSLSFLLRARHQCGGKQRRSNSNPRDHSTIHAAFSSAMPELKLGPTYVGNPA